MKRTLQIQRTILTQLRDDGALIGGKSHTLQLYLLMQLGYVHQDALPVTSENGKVHGYSITDKGREYLATIEAQ